jgi:HPt (histidine-containing phosphotransfer) domain-containing protein
VVPADRLVHRLRRGRRVLGARAVDELAARAEEAFAEVGTAEPGWRFDR